MKRYKRHKDYGFFDQDIRLSKLSQLGDPLENLNAGIDFEKFRHLLEISLSTASKGPGDRPRYNYVLMFKILILQRYYTLSDEQVEFQINDPMSSMRFLVPTIADDTPDSRTLWAFREQITTSGLIEKLFDLFLRELNSLGLIVNEGKIVAEKEMTNQVCEKRYRNKPLMDEQKSSNTEKSHIRSRMGHIFGFMQNSMNRMYYINSIGIKRATAITGLMNLTYNRYRKMQLLAIS